MKTRITALLLCFVVALGLMAGCSSEKPAAEPAAPASTAEPAPADAAEPAAPAGNYKVTLITMDQMDQHWVNVDKGCKEAVAELGNVDYNWLAPDVKDDAKQIECINNAVAGGAQAILLAANGPDAVTASLKRLRPPASRSSMSTPPPIIRASRRWPPTTRPPAPPRATR